MQTHKSDFYCLEIMKHMGRNSVQTHEIWHLSCVGRFLLLSLICLCASWRARTESSRLQRRLERQYLSHKTVCECLSGAIGIRRATEVSWTGRSVYYYYSHKLSFEVIDQEDKRNIKWRSNQYVLGKTKLLSVVRCTNGENVTYRSTLPVAKPINVHVVFHF